MSISVARTWATTLNPLPTFKDSIPTIDNINKKSRFIWWINHLRIVMT